MACGTGLLFVVGGFFAGYITHGSDVQWRQATKGGSRVVATVTEKHELPLSVLAPGAGNHYRLFLKPPLDLEPGLADLWRRTSIQLDYRGSNDLFRNWDQRTWDDVSSNYFHQVNVGAQIPTWINGHEAVLLRREAPNNNGWWTAGSCITIGLAVLIFGIGGAIRQKRWDQRIEDKRNARRLARARKIGRAP